LRDPRLKPWGTKKQNAKTTADPLSRITTRKTRAAAKAKAEQQIPPLRWNSRFLRGAAE
jgi:hypothetical protein